MAVIPSALNHKWSIPRSEFSDFAWKEKPINAIHVFPIFIQNDELMNGNLA